VITASAGALFEYQIANAMIARIPMKTPMQTTHILSPGTTAATTPRLRCISSINATVAQNPRPLNPFVGRGRQKY